MLYVFDTSSLIVTGHYYPAVYPGFWQRLDSYVGSGTVINVREVRNELDRQGTEEHLRDWVQANSHIFTIPSSEEMRVVADILAAPQFSNVISNKAILAGIPVADPFIVAAAKVRQGCVVTQESDQKPNAARIPNICRYFNVPQTNIEGFLIQEGWSFQ